MDHIKTVLLDFTENDTTLDDAYSTKGEDIAWFKAKLVDLEDRSCRNNLKIRGIPKNILSSQLPNYVRDLFLAVVPNLSLADLTIDQIQWLLNSAFLPAEIPRDVILPIHFCQVKEQLLEAFRHALQLPDQAQHLHLLPDVPKYTLKHWKHLLTITKALRNHNVP